MTRPEAGDSFGYQLPSDYDGEARQQFTPYRAGEPATRADREVEPASWTDTERHQGGSDDMARRPEAGDRVQNTSSVGGVLGGAVPAGTEGEVVSTRSGIFTEYATVRFANGYTEEVKVSDLKHESGWF